MRVLRPQVEVHIERKSQIDMVVAKRRRASRAMSGVEPRSDDGLGSPPIR